jgi:starch synthase
MREDVLRVYPTLDPSLVHVIRNGVDTNVWYPAGPAESGSVLAELGVDPSRPIVAFVGRITRQKGVGHLVAAAHEFNPDVQLVLCAGAPDTPELAEEARAAVAALARSRTGVHWIREMLPIGELREILSAATVFVCPSVYEPLGIVNLEAMACATAVVASDVGGIPEVVADGITGSLVHYDADDPFGFEAGLAEAVNELVANPDKAKRYGEAGRQRCVEEFSWAHVAEQTLDIYRKVGA